VVSKAQKFKAMYEATLEFTERWGGGDYRANPFHGEMSIFSGTKQCKLHVVFMLISVLLLNDFV